jgi:hypothetical protein
MVSKLVLTSRWRFCRFVQAVIGNDASKMELFTLHINTPFG